MHSVSTVPSVPENRQSGSDLPEAISERFLRSIQTQFYQGTGNLFFQERSLLLQAISYPARYLDDRSVAITAKRYTELLTDIIRTVNANGNLAQIRSPGRYLLHAVQEHMRHHGEDYYEIGKATRNAISDALAGLKTRNPNAAQAHDTTVAALAQTHRILSATKAGRKKAAPAKEQGSLF